MEHRNSCRGSFGAMTCGYLGFLDFFVHETMEYQWNTAYPCKKDTLDQKKKKNTILDL